MGNAVYPIVSASSSPIKSVQRGNAASAGSVTISSVNTAKSFVTSFSNNSAGSVGITGTNAGTLSPGGEIVGTNGSQGQSGGNWGSYSGTRTITPGTTSLTTKLFGAYLTDSTTLTVTGACYWQIVEYV